jgi:cytidyltransferase-like protein
MDWINIWQNNNILNNGYKFKDFIEYNTFIEEITKNIKIEDNYTILDIGCGDGYIIDHILKYRNVKNVKVYGLDILKNNTNYIKNNSKNYITHDFNETLPFKKNYFDLILCISSIFYLKNTNCLEIFTNEIDRVTKNNSFIFYGNCMDIDKKNISLEIRKQTHNLDGPEHLYISKNYFLNKYQEHIINIIDNNDLKLDFYIGRDYKYNVYIQKKNLDNINLDSNINLNSNINLDSNINLGVDFHDTISYNPNFFRNLLLNFKGKRYIITGTPLSKKDEIIIELEKLHFEKNVHYDDIEYGFEYEKENMNYSHFNKMKVHKLELLKKNNISVYFDDNPYYVDFLKDNNITVFQTILSKEYIKIYKNKDKYFCSNLQEIQFDYLNNFKTNENKKIYIPGVFDLFHIGHLVLIKTIKEQYNYIIILGLQSDKSVLKQKQKQPILSFEERKNFIENLNIVNTIIEYDDINQINILKNYNINYFCIGPEYGNCEEHLKTLEYCNNNNINLIHTNRFSNVSTSSIINKIKNI